jgi:hypothetical protein
MGNFAEARACARCRAADDHDSDSRSIAGPGKGSKISADGLSFLHNGCRSSAEGQMAAPRPGGSHSPERRRPESGGHTQGSSAGRSNSVVWPAVLFDPSSLTSHVTPTLVSVQRPEMPAPGGSDHLVGSCGEDLLVSDEGNDLLAGGHADGT